MSTRRIDSADRQILNIIQRDGRAPNSEIAKQVGLAPSAVHERLKKLRAQGLIRENVAKLDAPGLGLGLLAFVRVQTDEPLGSDAIASHLIDIPEVLEIHDVAGEDCYLLKVVARDIEHLHVLLRERIGKAKFVRSTSSTIVLKTVKDTSVIPIDLESNS